MPNIPLLPTITSITATDPTVTDAGTVHYTVTFSEPVTNVTSNQFSLVATGHIDGAGVVNVTPVDGSNGASYVVTVDTGTGDGTLNLQLTGGNVRDANGNPLSPFQSETDYVVGASFRPTLFQDPFAIAVGDINGDGKPDLLVGGSDIIPTVGFVETLLNNGDGTFKVNFSDGTPYSVSAVALGDFNGDGKVDIGYSNILGSSYVNLGNGDGTFATTPISYTGSFGHPAPSGDFNGDGGVDYAVANSGGIEIRLANSDGSFTSSEIAMPSASNAVAVADLNGDGKSDLLVTSSNNTVSVLLGNGDGTFQSPVTIKAGPGPYQMVVADLNGDGKLDVAIVDDQSPNISVLLNGATTASPTYTLNRGTPALTIIDPAVTLGADGSKYINATHFNGGNTTLTGAANAGETITLTDASGSAIGSTTVGTDGNWSINVSGLQDGATYSYVATATNAAGNSSSGPALSFTVDATAPSLSISGFAPVSPAGSITLSGTIDQTDAATTVTIYDGGNILGTATPAADGSWRLTNGALQGGLNHLTARATDAAGNTGMSTTFDVTLVNTGATVIAPVTGQYLVEGVLYVPTGITLANAIVTGGTYYAGSYISETGTVVDTIVRTQEWDNGISIRSQVSGTQLVYQGGQAFGATIAAGGYQVVGDRQYYSPGGGTVTDTALYGAEQVVAHGTAFHTTIYAGGNQAVGAGGTTSNTVINTGGQQYVGVGGSDSNASVDGGTQTVAGTAAGTTVNSGGVQNDYGTVSGAVVAGGGVQHVYQGAVANGTRIAAGGYQDVSGGTVTDTVLDGNEQVLAGGTAVHTTIDAGAQQYVAAGGTASNTVINASGVQFVAAGATDSGASIEGGRQIVFGTATATVIDGGEQDDYGTVSAALLRSGVQHVYQGGVANDTIVWSTAYQEVDGGTVNNTLLAGSEQVLGGGVANGTMIGAGATQYVGAGGTTSNTSIQGHQYVDTGAGDSGASIDGGLQFVAGTATGATVSGGGEQDIGSGGTAINTHLVNGIEHVLAGGLAQGIDFGGSTAASLVLDSASGLAGTIANFGIGDSIDFRNTVLSNIDIEADKVTITTGDGASFSWTSPGSGATLAMADDGFNGIIFGYQPATTGGGLTIASSSWSAAAPSLGHSNDATITSAGGIISSLALLMQYSATFGAPAALDTSGINFATAPQPIVLAASH